MAGGWRQKATPVTDWRQKATPVQPEPATDAALRSAGETAEAALLGFGQGASLMFSDELAGALGAGVAAGIRAIYGSGPEADEIAYRVLGARSAEEAGYDQFRDQQRQMQDKAAAEHAYAYGGASLLGGLATPGPKGIPVVGKVLGKIATTPARSAALMGAAQGIGSSESEGLTSLGAGAVGAGTGAVIGKFLDPENLQKTGIHHLYRSIAPAAGLSNRLRNKLGIASEPEQQKFASEVLKAGFVRPFEKSTTALARVEDTLQGSGGKIGELTSLAQEIAEGAKPAPPGATVGRASRDWQRQRVMDYLTSPKTPVEFEEVGPLAQQLLPRIGTDQPSKTLGPATFPELWQTKAQLQEALKPQEFSSLSQRMYRKAVGQYTKGVYEQMGAVLGPQYEKELQQAAQQYGTAAKVEDLLREKASREQQKASVGLLDLQKAQLAASTFKDIPWAGPAAAMVSKVWAPIADPTLTHAYLGAAKGMQSLEAKAARAGVQDPAKVLTEQAAKATTNAFDALFGRFGVQAKDKTELADEHYLKSQTDQQAQPGPTP